MILPFSGFFTIMRNALSTRHHQAKNSRLSTLVAKVTFGQLILSQNFQQISDNFFIQFFIYRSRRYQKIPPKRKARPRVLRTMKNVIVS